MDTIKVFFFIFIVIVVLGALVIYAKPNNQNTSTAPGAPAQNIFSVDKTLHDFGTISMKNGNVKTIFVVKNMQEREIIVNKMYTSCMCTEASLLINGIVEGPFGMPGHGFLKTFNQTLKSNEEARIEVEFDPTAHGPSGIGTIERTVVIEGAGERLLVVAIKANVTP